MSRVVRVLIYEGDEDHLKGTMENCAVPPNGKTYFGGGINISSIVVEAQLVPCLRCDTLHSNKELYCDACLQEAADYYKLSE